MTKSRLLLWMLMAWPLPALIAGALGWEGIWGSGSALLDYLIPIPVAGSALHMPSFVVTSAFICEGLPRQRQELLQKLPDGSRLLESAENR